MICDSMLNLGLIDSAAPLTTSAVKCSANNLRSFNFEVEK